MLGPQCVTLHKRQNYIVSNMAHTMVQEMNNAPINKTTHLHSKQRANMTNK